MAKVLANRLGRHIQSLIDPSQSAFFAGKSTLHSVATAQELISACQRHNWEGLLVNLDFRKTFDSLEWRFIFDTLAHRGFSQRWISWIENCLTGATSSLLINNFKGNHILCRRGLRQGILCPPTFSSWQWTFLPNLSGWPLKEGSLTGLGISHQIVNKLVYITPMTR